MSKVSRESAQVDDHGPVEDRHQDIDGYTVSFVTFREDIDATPLLKGAPDDSCQCPHWGYVVKGQMTFRYPDGEEVVEAGDAFYAPPGHVPIRHEPGTETVMFSPAEQLKATEALITKNMQQMQAG
jgi:hypothetical protein